MTDRMRFGVFHAPYHLPMGQNPTLALHRDVQFVKHLDALGFDEAWIGEHHSCGCEIIADPLMFVAHVAPQTHTIKLGSGVLSLPYHNPLWVADRFILLDHLTRGRVMLGLGPGADVRHGIDAWLDYFQDVQAAVHFQVAGRTTDERIDFVINSGLGVIGTPEDAVEQIEKLNAQSSGGFGAYLVMTHDWAPWAATLHSYELMAERVFPAFQGSTESLRASATWAAGERAELGGAQMQSVQNAMAKHAAETGNKGAPAGS